MSSLVDLEIQYQRLTAERDALGNRYEAGEIDLLPQIKDLNARIRAVILEIESLRAVTSSGAVVQDDQVGYGNNSGTVNPSPTSLILQNGRIQSPPDTTSGSNAIPPTSVPNNVDWGLNSPTRPYSLTQSTTPGLGLQSPGAVYSVGGINPTTSNGIIGPVVPGGLPGARPLSEDSGNGSNDTVNGSNDTVAQLNQINFGTVTPRGNILDQYASYTYQASLYLISADNYKRMVNTNEKNLADAQLLVQTGGASQIGRSEFFTLDYYIDDIEMDHVFAASGGSRLAHNVTNIKFTVVEPSGISFVQNLDAAVQKFLGGVEDKKKSWTSQIYLMVIRFYGYDAQGNLVRGGVNTPNVTSDPNAFVEKWYPINISELKFKVASKVAEYHIKGVVVPYFIGASSARGTIPFNVELSGQTIKDILAGPAVYAAGQSAVTAGGSSSSAPAATTNGFATTGGGAATGRPSRVSQNTNQSNAETNRLIAAANAAATAAAAPPKANSATSAKKTVRQGLMAALNEYQQDLVAKKVVTYPDTYEIEFALPALASAKIVNPAGLNKSATSMNIGGTAADQKLGSKQSMDPASRIQGATAGMQLTQFIDNLLRNSTYIKDQQTVIVNEKTGVAESTGINLVNTAWYKISFSATQGQYDPLRNDYAYNIKYTISPYKIVMLNSPYFKQPQYKGSHKQYVYWFAGENSAVLDYEETLDNLYYTIVSGSPDLKGITSSALEILKFQAQTASGQSNQSAENGANEAGANAADQLYSPSDLANCNLTIVGDPAWMAQGEAGIGIDTRDQFYFQPFLADGTINFESQQILFEIGYNTVKDYDLLTGLMDPDRGNLGALSQIDTTTRGNSPTKINRVYTAKTATSYFKKGKFTQLLRGKLKDFYTAQELADQGRKPAPTTPVTQTNKVKTSAPKWQQPVPSAIPANPGTLGAALNSLDVSYEGASIMAAAEEGAATRAANLANQSNAETNRLRAAPIPQRAPVPLPGTAPPTGSYNPNTLLPNRNPPQIIKREP